MLQVPTRAGPNSATALTRWPTNAMSTETCAHGPMPLQPASRRTHMKHAWLQTTSASASSPQTSLRSLETSSSVTPLATGHSPAASSTTSSSSTAHVSLDALITNIHYEQMSLSVTVLRCCIQVMTCPERILPASVRIGRMASLSSLQDHL